ncbi:MAG: dehydrogenase [Phycisphaerae bacterium]|nr:dehydrogenase [Phycisphaerae bacterium]
MARTAQRGTSKRASGRASTGPVRVGIIGTKFMGKAHANAWLSASRFFDLPRGIVMQSASGRDARETCRFAENWGWRTSTDDWHELVADPEVDLVDVCTPNHLHAPMSVEALAAGKHVACEKPLAGTLEDAREMRDAARKAKRKGQQTFVWFNYRRVPALAFAHQLIAKGRLGRIFHVRASYLQDWGHPDTPLVWRFDSKQAGSGAHGDLNAHIIDLARFLTGDEVAEVIGGVEETFVTRRELVGDAGAAIKGSRGRGGKAKTGRSTVDDAVLFLAKFKQGAVASFEATRMATGNLNRNNIEINGEKGSIKFDFERMNELEWWDHTLEPGLRGWSRIMCTEAGAHPYVESYWPAAHGLGYEHGFVSQVADTVRMLGGRKPEVTMPDFEDAFETQRVLEAAILSARERTPIRMSSVK